jgi:hypothetical protein
MHLEFRWRTTRFYAEPLTNALVLSPVLPEKERAQFH